MKAETLAECGLTYNESKVYLALLRLGSASAIEIAREAAVHRVNAYDILERLYEKGLISILNFGHKQRYEIASPQQLLHLVQQKEQLVQQLLPELELQYKSKKRNNVLQFFGPEGVMRAYFMMLEQKSPIYGLGGSGLNRKFLKHRHELWNKERISNGIKMKVLYYEFTRKQKESSWQNSTVEVRYLPNKFKTVGMVDVCGNLILNLIPVENNVMAIIIENKILADTYRQFFNIIWQFART